ncbi:hypothetical protein ACHAO9_007148 [Fusarium lateritium]
MLVLRLLSGFLQAPFYPVAISLLRRLYTRREVATRLAILYCGQLCSSSFSGLITAAIFASLSGHRGLHGWQLFIDDGTPTFGVATNAVFLLSDNPGEASWMAEAENACAFIRLKEDNINQLQHETAMQGLISALKDYKV